MNRRWMITGMLGVLGFGFCVVFLSSQSVVRFRTFKHDPYNHVYYIDAVLPSMNKSNCLLLAHRADDRDGDLRASGIFSIPTSEIVLEMNEEATWTGRLWVNEEGEKRITVHKDQISLFPKGSRVDRQTWEQFH